MNDGVTDVQAYPGAAWDTRWRRLVAPPDYRNPEPADRYHVVVIGAGTAGLVTAIAAAGLGARAALVEREAMGGDCLNVGCVPSKALLEFTARSDATFDTAFEWLRRVRAGIAEHDSVERFVGAGVDVFLGDARFESTNEVIVGDTRLRGRRVVIATGARAAIPPIPGLADARPLTNETVFDLESQPGSLAIVGAGPIGCELAQVFARLGTSVHLLEAADRILGTESAEAADRVAASLRAAGVTLQTGVRIKDVSRRGNRVAVDCGDSEVKADELLVAAGRQANTDELNLAGVGVQTDEAGRIVVDKHLRSTQSRIFAAGDVCTALQFTHHADAHARIVVQNALFLPTATTRGLVIPHCTYTTPEVAQVGPTAETLEREGVEFDRYRIDYASVDRGRLQGDDDGFVEVLTERGKAALLGGTIVGHDAGEQIAPLCLALSRGLGLDAFAKLVLPYPTRAEAFKRLADQFNRGRLTPTARRLFSHWFKWTLGT